MKQLNKPSDNLGGLLKIWAIPAHLFTLSDQTLTFTDTSEIVQLYCSPGTMSVEEPVEKTTAGEHFNLAVNGFIPGDSPEVRSVIREMQGKRYVVLFLDGNENFRLAGSSTYPLHFSFVWKSGSFESQRPGYEILFSGKTMAPSLFVNSPF